VRRTTRATTKTLDLIVLYILAMRQIIIRLTYLLFAIPTMVGTAALSIWLYAWGIGLSLDGKVEQMSGLEFFGFVVALLLPVPFGLSAGGAIWSRVAVRFLGVTGAEMERFLLSGQPSISFIERANRRAIDRLFKER
jgi:hypothetical protein